MRVKIKCPLCGSENNVNATVPYQNTEIIWCDSDAGGCDKQFACRVEFKPLVEVFKIEKVAPPQETL